MRKLIEEFAQAVAARATAAQVCMGGGIAPIGKKAPLLIAAEEREAKAREALEDAVAQASCLVSQAIGDVESIDAAKPLKYADDPSYQGGTNFDRAHNERRAFTLKDAKPYARAASRLLRQAWDILDPSITPTHGVKEVPRG